MWKYLNRKIHVLETNCKNKTITQLYSGTKEFKKGYQPTVNLLKDEKGNLPVGYWMYVDLTTLGRMKCSQVTSAQIQSLWDWSGYWKSCKGKNHQIWQNCKRIQAGGRTVHLEIHELINLCGIRKNSFSSGTSHYTYL